MCGIIAQINRNTPIDRMTFDAMRDTMTHRGPDGAGSEFFDQDRVALGHRRLSIIDLSAAGKQPMCNEDKTLWLTFNGEIYNYKALRKMLEAKGHQFQSNTDSEVLIHGYEEWGTSLVDHLKGMFAFGIWNSNEKTFFLARDRFGIKPLCYYQDDKTFIMASELKAIVKAPNVPTKLNPGALANYFIFRYIPSPESIWQGIHKLPPAHCMLINEQGALRKWCYWEPEFGQKVIPEKEVIEQFDELLKNSIDQHLISDTPVGLMLSGGLDSSTIAHYISRKGTPLNTFAVGFKNRQFSEHEDARLMAEELDTLHHELMIENEFSNLMDELVDVIDEPLGGTAFLPTYLVNKLACQHVKVVLGGHGGDEVLAGYRWHQKSRWSWQDDTRTTLKRLLFTKERYFLDSAFNSRTWTHWKYHDLKEMLNPELFKEISDAKDFQLLAPHYNSDRSFLKNAQALDIALFNNELNLSFLDKTSMAHSVEARVPFLDHELVEFVLSLNENLYFKQGTNKHILQELMANRLPISILNKPKAGFGFKIKKFLSAEQMEREIRDSYCFSSSEVFSSNIRNQDLKALFSARIWSIYIFCKWFDRWHR